MFPLRDENPTELTPYVTILLILANVAVWIFVQGAGQPQALEASVCALGAIPAELTNHQASVPYDQLVCPLGPRSFVPVITSMFLHGGWMHLIGNMWFLWIFGNNVEDSMGHLRFVVFYVLAGALAGAAHVLSAPYSGAPMVGASGAISGVMGAYLVLYPRVRVQTLFILFVFIRILPIPAWVVLLQWFGIQLLSSFATPTGGGGVAFFAHIGGFAAGVVLVKLFENRTLVAAKRSHVKLRRDEIPHRGWL